MFGTLNPFRGLLPHSRVSPENPLFAYYVRRVAWWVDWHSPRRTGVQVLAWTLFGVLLIGLGAVSVLVLMVDTESRLVRLLYEGFDYAAIGGLLAALVLDYVVMAAVLVIMVGGRNPLIDDLLHMTRLTAWDIVSAQHAMMRLQTWRLTMVLVGARLALVVLHCLLDWFSMPLLTGRIEISFIGALEQAYLFLLLLFLSVEPLWRYRMLAAVGIALSTRFQSVLGALVVGMFTVLLLMTVPQGVFVRNLFLTLVDIFYFVNPLLGFIGGIGLGAVIYFAYFSLENVALRRARRYTFREGRDDDVVEQN